MIDFIKIIMQIAFISQDYEIQRDQMDRFNNLMKSNSIQCVHILTIRHRSQ